MKKLLLSLVAFATFTNSLFGQSPEGFNYQAVIRNASNEIVANQAVGLRMTIRKDSIGGTSVYSETFSVTTNTNGLVNVQIGNGSVLSGTFANIAWGSDLYFIETAVDVTGGSNYVVMGTSQLMSVPYALYAKNGITTAQINALAAMQAQINSLNALHPPLNYSEGSIFCASGATLVVAVTNPTTGRIWMDRNLGASQAATSSTDVAAYGDLYQWGRGSDGHQCTNSATTTTLSSTDQPGNANFILAPNAPYDWRSPQNANLWQGVSGVNNPCPIGYRIPTNIELDVEIASWGQNNTIGAFTSPLKWPVPGQRLYTNVFVDVNDRGSYWSSSFYSDYPYYMYTTIGAAFTTTAYRHDGRSVRCIKH